MVFDKFKKSLSGRSGKSFGGSDEDYLEIDLNQGKEEHKVMVKLFVLKNYDEVNKVLNALREGYTIAVIETKILRQKDPIELKRAISKIKKTVDALEGSIVGFRENIIIATPSFAKVDRELDSPEEKKHKLEEY